MFNSGSPYPPFALARPLATRMQGRHPSLPAFSTYPHIGLELRRTEDQHADNMHSPKSPGTSVPSHGAPGAAGSSDPSHSEPPKHSPDHPADSQARLHKCITPLNEDNSTAAANSRTRARTARKVVGERNNDSAPPYAIGRND